MTRFALALLIAVSGSVQAAGAIYRCGPDGRTFSQAPCADGMLAEASDPRTLAQRAEAKRMAAAERKAAADKEREAKAVDAAAIAAKTVGR